jgi:hypothetical protein
MIRTDRIMEAVVFDGHRISEAADGQALRARAKIASYFYAPIHPAWRRCQSAEISRYSSASAPCQTGASTPKNINLFLREPLIGRLGSDFYKKEAR